MKAAVYYENGGPEVLKYEDVADPICPPRGIVVDVEVISLEGGDALHRSRTPLPQKPHIVGYQCAGTVREVGPEVKDRKVGQKVVVIMSSGSHAQRVAAEASMSWVLPQGADLATIACAPVAFGTAHVALFALGQLQAGQNVLVHAGAGGVGLAAIQLAKRAGAQVLTTASSNEKLSRLKEFGADHGINYASTSLVEGVTGAVGSSGVNLVIDPVGGKTLQDSAACLAPFGTIVNLGVAGRDATLFNPMALWGKSAKLIGFSLTAALAFDYARTYGAISDCIDGVAKGALRVVIDKKFKLSEASAAHTYIESRAAFGRVVMIP